MELFNAFIIENFILFLLCIVMYTNAFVHFHQHRRLSIYSIIITSCCLILAISGFLEVLSKQVFKSIALTQIFSILGYSLRPLCIYFFILMSGNIIKKKWFHLTYIPLIINFLIYCLMFVPYVRDYVVSFHIGDSGNVVFGGGPLRYTSHVVSALYLAALIYLSIYRLRSKHISHGLAILVCALFVVLAVVLESFIYSDREVHVLNATIMVGTLSYFFYLYRERAQIDSLTGTYNRETYYHDLVKMEKTVNGVVQFDMNGLKYINDNFGHFEGDKAISTIAQIIMKYAKRNMYVYRLGGDEFLLLAVNVNEDDILNIISKIKEDIGRTDYYCSIGYAYKGNRVLSLYDLCKEAEKSMYEDKANFYKNSPFERRKAE